MLSVGLVDHVVQNLHLTDIKVYKSKITSSFKCTQSCEYGCIFAHVVGVN